MKIVLLVLLFLLPISRGTKCESIDISKVSKPTKNFDKKADFYNKLAKEIKVLYPYSRLDVSEIANIVNSIQPILQEIGMSNLKFTIIDVLSIISIESSWIHEAKNKNSSALGLMQLTKAVSSELGYKHEDMLNPMINVEAGIRHLVYLNSKFSTRENVIIAYHSWKQSENYIKNINNNEYLKEVNNVSTFMGSIWRTTTEGIPEK